MVDEVRRWLHNLRRTDRDTLRQVSDALDLLTIEGPTLGRPIVDRIKGLEVASPEGAATGVVGCE